MAVSGKTTHLELPYFLGTDKPPDMAAVTKALAEAIEALKFGSRSLKPTSGLAVAGGTVTLSGSFQTVCSVTLTPAVASTLQIVGLVRVDSPPTLTNLVMAIDGVASGSQTFIKGGNGIGVIVGNLSLTAAEHTIALQARRSEGSGGTIEASAGGGSFIYTLYAS